MKIVPVLATGAFLFGCNLSNAQGQMGGLSSPSLRQQPRRVKQARPRLGRYYVYSNRGGGAVYIDRLELFPNKQYRVSSSRRQGTYRYNAQKKTFQWLSGPYHTRGWGGTYRVKGGRHTIKLTRYITATSF